MLDARNFFNRSSDRPAVKQNQFGFTLRRTSDDSANLQRVVTARSSLEIMKARESGARARSTRSFRLPPCDRETSPDAPTISDPMTNRPDSVPRQPHSLRASSKGGALLPAVLSGSQHAPRADYAFAPGRRNDADKFDLRMDHHFSVADTLSSSYSLNERARTRRDSSRPTAASRSACGSSAGV